MKVNTPSWAVSLCVFATIVVGPTIAAGQRNDSKQREAARKLDSAFKNVSGLKAGGSGRRGLRTKGSDPRGKGSTEGSRRRARFSANGGSAPRSGERRFVTLRVLKLVVEPKNHGQAWDPAARKVATAVGNVAGTLAGIPGVGTVISALTLNVPLPDLDVSVHAGTRSVRLPLRTNTTRAEWGRWRVAVPSTPLRLTVYDRDVVGRQLIGSKTLHKKDLTPGHHTIKFDAVTSLEYEVALTKEIALTLSARAHPKSTGLYVFAGQRLRVRVRGTICAAPRSCSRDGIGFPHHRRWNRRYNIYSNLAHAGTFARVEQRQWVERSVRGVRQLVLEAQKHAFGVPRQAEVRARRSGLVFIGINDTDRSNNRGSVAVRMWVGK